MNRQRTQFIILLVMFVLLQNFLIPLSTSNLLPIKKTDKLHDDLWFDSYSKKDQNQSRYEFCSKTMLNHNSNSTDCNNTNNKQHYEPVSPGVTDQFDGDDALLDSCWPMKSQNRRHTGLSPYSTEDNNGMVKWTYESDSIEGGIAIDNDGVIGYMRLVGDMPLLSLFKKEANEIIKEKNFRNPVEISRFVIDEKYRIAEREVIDYDKFVTFFLFKEMYKFVFKNNLDSLFIVVHPRYKDRYEKYYFFKQSGEEKSYDKVLGNPAVLLFQDVKEAEEKVKKIDNELYSFMTG